jgi:orotidine-5'-phosphate decarboxylase
VVNGFASRISAIRDTLGPLCIGLDPSTESLTKWGLPDTADGAIELGRVVLAAASGRVGIVKPQIGFFERFGSAGFVAVETLIREARSAGLVVIADAKRGDVGTTMASYAAAWLSPGPLHSDAMTVSPYQGFDALEPAFLAAERVDGAVFVLCATSNPDAHTVQSARVDGRSVPARIAQLARERSGDTQTVGLVVGATRTLAESGLDIHDLDDLLILAPGFGAQGAALSEIATVFGPHTHRVIPTVSRSVLGGGASRVGELIDRHLRELGL